MTKPELKSLYVDAAIRARIKPSQSEEAVWFSKLGHFDIVDLKAAIDAHFDKTTWMPKEGELRNLAEQAKRGRVLQSNSRTTYARWQCPDHPGIVVGGFVDQYDFKPRRCPKAMRDPNHPDGPVICGAKMNEIFRENNFTTGNSSAQPERQAEVA